MPERGSVQAETALGRAPQSIWRLVRSTEVVVPMGGGCAPQSAIPFYCVHPIAGDVTSFRPLAEALGNDQAFYGLQVPTGQLHGQFASSIEAMAQHYVQVVTSRQPEGPMVLGGWSAGAIVALEMAQQFQRCGRVITALVAFDGAPCNTGVVPPSRVVIWARVLLNMPAWVSDLFVQARRQEGVLRLLTQKFRYYAALRRKTESDSTMDTGAVVDVLQRTRGLEDQRAFIVAFYDAAADYVASRYQGKVVVFEMKTQPLLQQRIIANAWRMIATDVDVVRMDGGHNAIFAPPALQTIAARLRRLLT